MAARNRNSVAPSASSDSTMTYSKFLERFPDNDACVEYLREKFYADGSECPGCGKETKYYRVTGRAAYSCMYCRHQVYPTAGTIFHKSTVSLQLWFFAIYLMSSTRCGISAKQLEREIGVTYKTAHRMFKQIRTLLSDEGDEPLSGKVEADETWVGGKPRAYETRTRGKGGASSEHLAKKAAVFAVVERGGRIRARVHEHKNASGLVRKTIFENVLPSSMIFTDDWKGYRGDALSSRYAGHKRIRHAARVYVDGDTHTQTVEGFFGLFKTGVPGVYHAISTRYLQDYLNEYTFRYNRRNSAEPMFWAMLNRVEKTSSRPQLGAA